MADPQELLSCPEDEFDECIKLMDTKGLIDSIVILQKEMSKEQEHFNALSLHLGEIDDQQNAEEHQSISADLMQSQGRLAMLMGRNMKCFTQQTMNQNQELKADTEGSEEYNGYHEDNNGYHNGNGMFDNRSQMPLSINEYHEQIEQSLKDKLDNEENENVPSPNEKMDSLKKSEFLLSFKKDDKPIEIDIPVSEENILRKDVFPSPTEKMDSPEKLNSVSPVENRDCPTISVIPVDENIPEENISSSANIPVYSVNIDSAMDSQNLPKERDQKSDFEQSQETISISRVVTETTFRVRNVKHEILSSLEGGGKPKEIVSIIPVIDHNDGEKDQLELNEKFEFGERKQIETGAIMEIDSLIDALNEEEERMTEEEILEDEEDETKEEPEKVKVGPEIMKVEEKVKVEPEIMKVDEKKVDIEPKIVKFELGKVLAVEKPAGRRVQVMNGSSRKEGVNLHEALIAEIQQKTPVDTQPPSTQMGGLLERDNDVGDKVVKSSVTMVLSPNNGAQANDRRSNVNIVPQEILPIKHSDEVPEQRQETGTHPGSGEPVQILLDSKNSSDAVAKPHVRWTDEIYDKHPTEDRPVSDTGDGGGDHHTSSGAPYKSTFTPPWITEKSPKPSDEEIEDNRAGQASADRGVTIIASSQPPKEQQTGSFMGNLLSQIKAHVEGKVSPPDGAQLVANGDGGPAKNLPPHLVPSKGFTGDEKIQDRVTLKNWNPAKVLAELYKIQLAPDEAEDHLAYINMEGHMEKLPMNKKKATLLKTWKRRYFKAKDGHLYYYEYRELEGMVTLEQAEVESTSTEKANGFVQLSGGNIEDLGNRMIGIDDGRGRYLVVRCPTETEFDDWKRALQSQTIENIRSLYVKPVLRPLPNLKRKVIVVDIGSASVRAGILGDQPSLPQLFFPSIMATNPETRERTFGPAALDPHIRATQPLSYPVRPSVKIDKFALDMEAMPSLFTKIFTDLNVNPDEYWLMFSTPGNFSDKIKEQFMDILVKQFHMIGANILNQTLLTLYSYSATSGIVVDIGERLEIVPVTDGYIVESGVTRQPYGGHRVTEALNSSFTESKYRFFTDVEFDIVRLAMEKSCYVAEDYNESVKKCRSNPDEFQTTINLEGYDLPQGTWTSVTHDMSRFKSPEGLFNTEIWGMDNPPLHKLVHKAVQACPMDMRREMWRSIYLSGGVTMLPGFAERLQRELTKLVPASIKVQIHASPQRYHSAYIGACTMANLSVFESACISAEEWKSQGPKCLRKWHMY